MLTIVGVDSGNKYMKIVSADEILKDENSLMNGNIFRNIVSQGKRRVDLLSGHFEKNMDVLKELDVEITNNDVKTRYFVGDLAIKEGRKEEYIYSKDKLNSEFGRATFLTALALMTKDDNQKFIVGTGLPVMDHGTALRDSYSKVLGKHTVRFISGPWEGTTKEFEILGVRVYAQGLGVFFDNVIDNSFHEIGDHEFFTGFNAVIDIGSKKSNIILFEDGQPINAASLEHGMNDVLAVLTQNIESKDYEVPVGRDEDILKMDNFKNIDLAAIRKSEFKVLAQFVKDKADEVLGSEITFIKKIYVAGGAVAGKAGEEIIKFLNYENCEKVSYPQFANARGFCKAAVAATLEGNIKDVNGNTIEIEQYNSDTDMKVSDEYDPTSEV